MTMRSPELVIFDCDGVLVDSEPLANRLLCESVNDLGIPVTYEQTCRRWIGRTMQAVLDDLEAELGRPLPAGWLRDLRAREEQAYRRELKPVAGVAAAIDALHAAGLRTCVASSGEIAKMHLTLGTTGLLSRLDARLYSASMVAHGKPAPDLFLHAAAGMGASPSACVVVEDSRPGMLGGLAAGMRVLGYLPDGGLHGGGEVPAGVEPFATMAELPRLVGVA